MLIQFPRNKNNQKISIIRAGSYEDLPPQLQQAIDRVKANVNKPMPKRRLTNDPEFLKRIEDILRR